MAPQFVFFLNRFVSCAYQFATKHWLSMGGASSLGQMKRLSCTFVISGAILVLPLLSASAQGPSNTSQRTPDVQSFALTQTKDLIEQKVKVEAVEYKGRKAIRLNKQSYEEGFALVNGVEFQDGTIEADVAVKVTTPPGGRMPGFIGIAFRAKPDASRYELFYLRPGNSQSDDQAMRNHSVQYSASPDFSWYRLRREWPWIYEAYADLQPEAWTKMKIEVTGRRAKLYVNGSTQPTLIVDGLKGEDLRGAVALSGYPGQESYFSNLRITHVQAQPVENGGEVIGSWDVKYTSDAGMYTGSMKLNRDGNKVSGSWSGAFGPDQPVAGTWRNGYVELTFPGTWPKMPLVKPGPVTATLVGWIDGFSAKGRMKVEGRADGQWTATRKE